MTSLRTSEPIITLALTLADSLGNPITRTFTLTAEHPSIEFADLYAGVELLGLHVDPLDAPPAAPELPALIGDSLTPPHHHHPDGTVCRQEQCTGPQRAYLYLDLAGDARVMTHRETAHRAAEAARSIVAVLPIDGDYRSQAVRTRDMTQGLFDALNRPDDELPTSAVPLALVDEVMTHAIAAVPGGRDRVVAMLSADAHDPDGDKAFADTAGMAGLTPTPIAEAISGTDFQEPAA